MRYQSTITPPAVVSYVTHASTNAWSVYSLKNERIRSAFDNAQRELGRYERYPPRWDGYHAEPFDRGVLQDASNILSFSEKAFLSAGVIPKLVTTGPASDGSIDVEVVVADRRVLMTLYPDEQLRLTSIQSSDTHEQHAPLGTDALATWLAWLHDSTVVQNMAHQANVHT